LNAMGGFFAALLPGKKEITGFWLADCLPTEET